MDESTPGREPVTLVELDQDFCQLNYGESPCEAELGVTGDRKCYNTRATCQDPDNYDLGTLTLRFAKTQAELPWTWQAIPSVQSVSTNPTEINPGGGNKDRSPLGSRAKVRVRFKDHPHSDFRTDPYRDERDYKPLERGTFWSKWLARNPYHRGRLMRIREGYIDQNPEDMVTRHYVIKEVSGPDANGRVTIKGEDLLSLTDISRAQAPRVTEGELLEDIDETADSLTIVNYRSSDDYPDPSDFEAGYGTVRISDEVIRYNSRSVSDGEITLSNLTRGADGSEADSHDAEDNVQLCLRYTNEPVWEVARDLLENYANIPAAYIPFADWEEEADTWLAQFTVTTLITEPEGVQDLLGEITEQCQFFIWWDERDQEIKLKALRPPNEVPTQLDDYRHIKADSWTRDIDDDQRISQVWVYYFQRDPTESLDEPTNYKRLRVRIDAEAEQPEQYDERKIKRIYSRWLESKAQAINVASRLLNRYRDGAQYLTLKLDAKDRELWTGDVADVQLWSLVDATGAPRLTRYQVISAEEVQPGETVEYDLLNYEYGVRSRFAYWMEDDAPDYSDATDEERDNFAAFWSDDEGKMPDGTDGYEWI